LMLGALANDRPIKVEVAVQSARDFFRERVLDLRLPFRLSGEEHDNPAGSHANEVSPDCKAREVGPSHRRYREYGNDKSISAPAGL
jgi:hypothetical protein